MKRREFFAASAATGLALSTANLARAAAGSEGKQLIELRTFSFDSTEKLERFAKFAGAVAVPALNRAGVQPVGVLRLSADDNPDPKGTLDLDRLQLNLWAVMVHDSLDSVLTLMDRLGHDAAFLADGREVLEAPADDPAYLRFESSLLLAFDQMPRVAIPSRKDSRVLQLRTYESHSVERHIKKVEMFNDGGEMAVFHKTGLNPVFFGQAIIGSKLPNLTYMLGFDDIEAKQAAWPRFIKHPGWEALKDDPQYADTVSHITNLILRPVAGSQI